MSEPAIPISLQTTPRPQVDSYAPLLVAIQFKRKADPCYYVLPAHNFFLSLNVKIISTAWAGKLSLMFPYGAYKEFRAAPGGTGPAVPYADITDKAFLPNSGTLWKIQWNWDIQGLDLNSAPVLIAATFTPQVRMTAEGISWDVDIASSSLTAVTVDRSGGPRAWPAGKKGSEVVKEIADYYGWASPLIEVSEGTLPELKITEGMTHIQFIHDRICAQTVSGQGEHFRLFFDLRERLHFHSPCWGVVTPTDEDKAAIRTYRVYADMTGEVEAFETSDQTFYAAMMGGGSVTYGGTNAEDGRAVEYRAARDTGVNYKGIGYHTPDEHGLPSITATNVPPAGATVTDGKESGFKQIPGRTEDEVKARAEVTHSKARELNYKATLTVKGTHDLERGDYIRLIYTNMDGTNNKLFSGWYRVYEMEHTLGGGSSWKTVFTIIRQGGFEGDYLTGPVVDPENGVEPSSSSSE